MYIYAKSLVDKEESKVSSSFTLTDWKSVGQLMKVNGRSANANQISWLNLATRCGNVKRFIAVVAQCNLPEYQKIPISD